MGIHGIDFDGIDGTSLRKPSASAVISNMGPNFRNCMLFWRMFPHGFYLDSNGREMGR